MSTPEPLLRIENVYKSFGPKHVLRGVDLTIARGECVTLLGPSGVGKSVLLKLIIGLMPVDAGRIVFNGRDVARMDSHELLSLRLHIGMVFQGAALFDSDTVGDNVAFGLHELGHRTISEDAVRDRVSWALDAVGLPGTEAMYPAELSGGMRKRVGIARTIAMHPDLILYDEPTMGLDPINSARIGHLISSLRTKLQGTALIVTHDIALAHDVSDRVALLHEGQIVACDSVPVMFASADPRVREFLHGREERSPAPASGHT